MKYTSAEANKLLKMLETKRNTIRHREDKAASFMVSVGEDIEEVRPKYDFAKTQSEIKELNEKIRLVKHAINVFNTTHILPGTKLTVDQVLVYLPQLSEHVKKLKSMVNALPRERRESYRSNVVDYSIANYDFDEVEKEYESANKELTTLQLALDTVNNNEYMEIDVTYE